MLEPHRQKMYEELIKMEIFPPFSVLYILSIVDAKVAKVILKFISNANLNL